MAVWYDQHDTVNACSNASIHARYSCHQFVQPSCGSPNFQHCRVNTSRSRKFKSVLIEQFEETISLKWQKSSVWNVIRWINTHQILHFTFPACVHRQKNKTEAPNSLTGFLLWTLMRWIKDFEPDWTFQTECEAWSIFYYLGIYLHRFQISCGNVG